MEYKVNASTTTTTSEKVNEFLDSLSSESLLKESETPVEISFEVLLQKTANKLFGIFSKMYYDVLSDEKRLELLEYCITIYTGVKRNTFANFSALGLRLQSKDDAMRYFLIHLIILIAEKEEKRPLEIVQNVCNGILSYKEKNKFIIKPINATSKIPATQQLFVRIDDYLINLKENPLDIQLLVGLLVQLILLDMCDEYIK